jgi:hypothetical protein
MLARETDIEVGLGRQHRAGLPSVGLPIAARLPHRETSRPRSSLSQTGSRTSDTF